MLESAGTLLGVLTPLVAVPLTVITFYLRSLREHQVTWHGELIRRLEAVEASAVDVRKTLSAFERDYTAKEEWLRECMLARHRLAHLTEMTVRLEANLHRNVAGSQRSPVAGSASHSAVATERQDDMDETHPNQGNP